MLGNNMFAYCLNNPVLLYDSSGAMARISKDLCYTAIYEGGGISGNTLNWQNLITGMADSISSFLGNTDDATAIENLKAYGVSFYNGSFVMVTPFDASFSFGFIGLSSQQLDANILRHEYGHTVQLKNMGFGKYVNDVVIPSITINLLDRQGKLPYDYYSYPWEAEANALGGSNLTQEGQPALPDGGYKSYWDLIMFFFS